MLDDYYVSLPLLGWAEEESARECKIFKLDRAASKLRVCRITESNEGLYAADIIEFRRNMAMGRVVLRLQAKSIDEAIQLARQWNEENPLDVFDKIERAYIKWKEANFPALGLKVGKKLYEEMVSEVGGKLSKWNSVPIEIDEALPENAVAFKEATTGKWEIIDLANKE